MGGMTEHKRDAQSLRASSPSKPRLNRGLERAVIGYILAQGEPQHERPYKETF